MKILFFCGSLEPGRDGVGDYTFRLARECATRGHDCTVIALNDRHASRATDLTSSDVRLIRLPATDPWTDRLACAGRHVRGLAPDWVSWQLVAYGFHPRGFLPAALLQAAPELRGVRCHAMMHELWLGLEAGTSWRARAIGWLQRRGILCLLDRLDPDCLHTSQRAYQHALQREGFEAEVLELFGNVPIAVEVPDAGSVLAPWLPAPSKRAESLVALTFGTLHPQWRPAATVDWLEATARRLGRTPALVAIGRTGAHAPAILDEFRRRKIHVGVTGELEATTVSLLLRSADFGIAPHPWELIGKSGAAVAMLEHGLPVLVPRDDWRLRSASLDPDPQPAGDPLLARLAGLDAARTDQWLARRRAPAAALPRVTERFLMTLELTPDFSGPPPR